MNALKTIKKPFGLGLLLAVVVLGNGCSVYNRFKPNTLVKEFVVDGDKPKVGDYELTVIMQAKEIGNKAGIDNYRIVLQLKSIQAINSPEDSLNLPIPRFNAVSISSDGNDQFTLALSKDKLAYRKLDVPPQIFRNHFLEYFDIRGIDIPDEINRIRIDATAEFFSRYDLSLRGQAEVYVYLDKRQSIEWYDPSKIEQSHELEGLESYRGSKIND